MNGNSKYDFFTAEGEMAKNLRQLYNIITTLVRRWSVLMEMVQADPILLDEEFTFITSRLWSEKYVIGIMVRCFWLAYADVKDKTITKKGNEWLELLKQNAENSPQSKSDIIMQKLYDPEATNRTRAIQGCYKTWRESREEELEYWSSMGIEFPKSAERGRVNAPIYDDEANLLMTVQQTVHRLKTEKANTPKTLLHIYSMDQKRISDTKSLSNKDIAIAFDIYDELFEKANGITDYSEYVNEWVNLCRYEASVKGTLIAKIARYMVDHDISDLKLTPEIEMFFCLYFRRHQVRLFGDQFSFSPNIVLQNYQFLDYDDMISLCLDKGKAQHERERKGKAVLLTRYIACQIINVVRIMYPDIFKPYFESRDKDSIDRRTMYLFCKECWPFLEKHRSSGVYSNSNGKIDHKLIRKIRNVISVFNSVPCSGEENLYIDLGVPKHLNYYCQEMLKAKEKFEMEHPEYTDEEKERMFYVLLFEKDSENALSVSVHLEKESSRQVGG